MATETPAIPPAVTEAESAALLRRMREAQQAMGDRALVPVCGRPSTYRWTAGFKILRSAPRPSSRTFAAAVS